MYLIPCGVILKVGKCVLQLVDNLAFTLWLHRASIGKYVLQIELKRNAKSFISFPSLWRSDRMLLGGLIGP